MLYVITPHSALDPVHFMPLSQQLALASAGLGVDDGELVAKATMKSHHEPEPWYETVLQSRPLQPGAYEGQSVQCVGHRCDTMPS